MTSLPPLVILCGATATGKTALALHLADRYPVEIVSADSRQVYRGMDIGTAKPTREERGRVPHHLLDVVGPDEPFTVSDYADRAWRVATDIHSRGKLPLAVGGTGLYLQVLASGLVDAPAADIRLRETLRQREVAEGPGTLYRMLQQVDPEGARKIHQRNLVRIIRALEVHQQSGIPLSEMQRRHQFQENRFRTLWLGLETERDELNRRIDARVEEMFAAGLVNEVQALLDRGYDPALKAFDTIGYREVIDHCCGKMSLNETIALVQRNTRRYAKRQGTWFRKNSAIIWVDSLREFARISKLIECFNA